MGDKEGRDRLADPRHPDKEPELICPGQVWATVPNPVSLVLTAFPSVPCPALTAQRNQPQQWLVPREIWKSSPIRVQITRELENT